MTFSLSQNDSRCEIMKEKMKFNLHENEYVNKNHVHVQRFAPENAFKKFDVKSPRNIIIMISLLASLRNYYLYDILNKILCSLLSAMSNSCYK